MNVIYNYAALKIYIDIIKLTEKYTETMTLQWSE